MVSADGQLSATRATYREWAGLSVIALPCLLYSMDLNVLHLAIPHLTADLKPTATQLLWIVDIYGFLLAGFLIMMGTLGDRIGRRRLLVIGAVAFALASLLAAFSTSAEMLILSRGILGIAGATLAPSTLSLIRNMFLEPRQRTLAVGIWGSCFAVGGALGPVVGGILLEHFWWGSVFLVAVPLMAVLVVVAPILLPEFRSPHRGRLDVVSSIFATIAILLPIHGIKRVAEQGADLHAALTIVVGLIIALLFVRRQLRSTNPMIDVHLFRDPTFSTALVASMTGVFAASGSFLYVTQYLQLVADLSPLEAGMWLAPLGLVHLAGAILTPSLVRQFGPRTVLIGGFLMTALGYATLTGVPAGRWLLMSAVAMFFAGLAPVLTTTTDLVMSAVPPGKAGTASGISETSSELGAALGIAILGSVATAVYRMRMDQAGLEDVQAVAVATARETAAAGIAAAHYLQGRMADELLRAVRDAFTTSMQAAAVASFGISMLGAICCAKFMKTR
jgi:MFS transporter, DHA2 family, multidrug resistance protein